MRMYTRQDQLHIISRAITAASFDIIALYFRRRNAAHIPSTLALEYVIADEFSLERLNI